jgi:hypothetical protein
MENEYFMGDKVVVYAQQPTEHTCPRGNVFILKIAMISVRG